MLMGPEIEEVRMTEVENSWSKGLDDLYGSRNE